jgi:PAS domain S-box-containing protein
MAAASRQRQFAAIAADVSKRIDKGENTMASTFTPRGKSDMPMPFPAEEEQILSSAEAVALLEDLASVFSQNSAAHASSSQNSHFPEVPDPELPNLEAKYRALVEQIPAVIFMAYLDRGIGEAYVNPQIEASLGFKQEEWLQDPVRWYQQIHPDDKQRWSVEAADMFLSGKPLRSAYRVIARDGRVIWFHCDAKMMRHQDGRPWFIHGVAFDITDLKKTEEALQEERNLLSAFFDTVGALVVVLDPAGCIVRFNRTCEQMTGYTFGEVEGRSVWELFMLPEDVDDFKARMAGIHEGHLPGDYESQWVTRDGGMRLIAWSSTVLPGADARPAYIIATGIDVTERKRLEKTILEVSAREQRRIGQDLHDGLGQHLTGIAFMSKVQQQKLTEKTLPEAADAAKIVRLVNEAIHKTRELARGLLPVMCDANGLMSALQHCAGEARDIFGVDCQLQCDPPVFIDDIDVATHLYHIAQEALNNAIRHGKAHRIVIALSSADNVGELAICDDGLGITGQPANGSGMGLHIMGYRARMIEGSLDITPGMEHGTLVRCTFPMGKDRSRNE